MTLRFDLWQREAGHWGTPLMVFEAEPFLGQDRVDDLVWRLHQHGLRKRDATAGTAREA